MKNFPKTTVLRHRKENLKKCSLRGLELREDFQFLTYPIAELPNLEGYILLTLEGTPLGSEDASHGLLVLDGTWRYAEVMKDFVVARTHFIYRSLPPGWQTAYPRRQEDCSCPGRGLASIEAIYAAYQILGRDTDGLLDHYYWKEAFLSINAM